MNLKLSHSKRYPATHTAANLIIHLFSCLEMSLRLSVLLNDSHWCCISIVLGMYVYVHNVHILCTYSCESICIHVCACVMACIWRSDGNLGILFFPDIIQVLGIKLILSGLVASALTG